MLFLLEAFKTRIDGESKSDVIGKVQVALSGSLTKAAGIMGYSQPGISHMISSLENEYGFSIFHRNRDTCTLTENGKQVLHYCSQIIKYENYLQDTIHSLNGLLSGSIRISSISSMLVNFVPKVIQHFSSTYSNIDIQEKERTFEQIYSDLQDGFSDIAFTNDKVDKSFDFISLLKDPVCLIMPPGYPFSKYEELRLFITGSSLWYKKPVFSCHKFFHMICCKKTV